VSISYSFPFRHPPLHTCTNTPGQAKSTRIGTTRKRPRQPRDYFNPGNSRQSCVFFITFIVSFPCTTERRSFLTVGYSSGFTWSGGHKKAFNRRRLFSLSLLFSILALLLNNTTKLPFICSFPIPSLLRCYILIYTVIIALAFLKARHLSLTSCDSASQPAILVCLPKTSLAIYNATHPAQAR
jgi:hypothetical protein